MKNLFIVLFFFFSVSVSAQLDIKTNSPVILATLEEFADGVEFYNIDYQDQVQDLKKILLVKENNDFISSYENGILKINSKFSEFPELLRIQVFQSLGRIYGLKYHSSGRSYMSVLWQEISLQNELFAYRHRQRPISKKNYLEALKQANPLKYQSI